MVIVFIVLFSFIILYLWYRHYEWTYRKGGGKTKSKLYFNVRLATSVFVLAHIIMWMEDIAYPIQVGLLFNLLVFITGFWFIRSHFKKKE